MRINYQTISDNDEDRDWKKYALLSLSRGYSDNEPEYDSSMIKE